MSTTIFDVAGDQLAPQPHLPVSDSAAPALLEQLGNATAAPWQLAYRRSVMVLDALSAAVAGLCAFETRFGIDDTSSSTWSRHIALVFLFPLVWLVSVALSRGYDSRVFGSGPEEFRRICRAFVAVVAIVAICSYTAKAEIARGFVFVALPMVLIVDLALRYGARRVLHRRRLRGHAMASIVVVGHPRRVLDLANALRDDSFAGYTVVGACLPAGARDEAGEAELDRLGIARLGDIDDIRSVVEAVSADIVAVTSSNEVGSDKLRWIAWQLEGTSAELAVSPGLVDVAGARIQVRLAAGLPLLFVEAPRFTGPHKLLKGGFDRVVAAFALVTLSPLILVLALLVRVGSKGPALFRQTRVGKNGKTFTMIKFRSMYTDAEEQLLSLRHQNENDGLLFKMRDDPRVTKVGKVLRRFSLDELPQLINVLTGSMSLVGPRPPLPSEVGQYGDDVRRRLLVKPGLTGLWQVSGRSDLSWEDSVRLDLRYVENWSLSMDMMLLWKTARAVVGASGAY